MSVIYAAARLCLGAPANAPLVGALQAHLRRLGYFAGALDGHFGEFTDRAVRALQHDLLHNVGASRGADGRPRRGWRRRCAAGRAGARARRGR